MSGMRFNPNSNLGAMPKLPTVNKNPENLKSQTATEGQGTVKTCDARKNGYDDLDENGELGDYYISAELQDNGELLYMIYWKDIDGSIGTVPIDDPSKFVGVDKFYG